VRDTGVTEIARCADDHSAAGAKTPRHQSGITRLTGPNHGVEAFFNDVYQAIRIVEVQLDVWVEPLERSELRHKQRTDRGQANAQLAPRG